MAGFKAILPDDIMADFKAVGSHTEEIFGAMTEAGADVAEKNLKANAPSGLGAYVKKTRTYRTPSDGGINTKVYFSGYLPFKGNRTTFVRRGRKNSKVYTTRKGIPADFLANIFEYGRSGSPFPKKPFMRKSFRESEINEAMKKEADEQRRKWCSSDHYMEFPF